MNRFGRWGFNPFTQTYDDEAGLYEMLEFGVKEIRTGRYEALLLSVFGDEHNKTRQYMQEKHPDITYYFK